jgi:hypothetical protein
MTLKARVLKIVEHDPGIYTADVVIWGAVIWGNEEFLFDYTKATMAFGGSDGPKRTLTPDEQAAVNALLRDPASP